MARPSIEALPAPFAACARRIATRIEARGARAWLVGGAVRDLALGLEPKDLDVASALRPDEVDDAFPTAHEVGRAFGTTVIVLDGVHVQHTTFRLDAGYSDGRRPDAVHYGDDPLVDARRRDFTCNALYLDPLRDEVLDPEGGLADLRRRLLRCVGDPRARFAEDGLRILRMARFAAGYGLVIDPDTLAAARAACGSLRGVSRERVLGELERLAQRPGAANALATLAAVGAWQAILGELGAPRAPRWIEERLAVLGRLGEPTGLELLLAALFHEPGAAPDAALGFLRALRASRRTQEEVGRIWRLAQGAAQLCGSAPGRAATIRLARDPAWPEVLRLTRAEGRADPRGLGRLTEAVAALSPDELWPEPWLRSEDLREARIAPGPRWGELLARAEELQLAGVHRSREEALAWLASEAAGSGR